MTRVTFLIKWAVLASILMLGFLLGPLSALFGTVAITWMAWRDRSEFAEFFGTAGQYLDLRRHAKPTSVFVSRANVVHVEFDPKRDDLHEITKEAATEGFEEFDRASLDGGVQVLIFRRKAGR